MKTKSFLQRRPLLTRSVALGCITSLLILIASACADVECYDTLCIPVGSGSSSSSGNPDAADRLADADVPDVPPPEDCVQEADAKDAPQCVVDTFALFVDAAGNDNNPGTKDKPLQRIQTALERAPTKGLRRVYVCGLGPFAEHLKPPSSVHIFGGFTCGSWTYAEGTRAKIAPIETGFVLHLDGIAAQTRASDLDLVAPDLSAATDGSSSIAVFVSSSNASFLRTSIVGGNGAKGTTPQPSGNGTLDSVSAGMNVLDGNPATSQTTPGPAKTCTCSNSGTNEKSMGGNGGMVALDGTSGRPLGGGGSAGLGGVDCSTQNGNGGTGSAGAVAASAIKIDTLGSLRADGWFPAKGNDAVESGKPGHGGGGGGGRNGSNAGGGGACGGCGGLPGKAGSGGGASIGLLTFTSTVLVRASNITAKAGGIGGGGGSGGPGQSGGAGAGGSTLGCLGGSGGMGGAGGHGGGGAGGISFGILYSGTKPDSDAPILQGSIGAAGPSGGTASNAGPPGVVGDVKDVSQL